MSSPRRLTQAMFFVLVGISSCTTMEVEATLHKIPGPCPAVGSAFFRHDHHLRGSSSASTLFWVSTRVGSMCETKRRREVEAQIRQYHLSQTQSSANLEGRLARCDVNATPTVTESGHSVCSTCPTPGSKSASLAATVERMLPTTNTKKPKPMKMVRCAPGASACTIVPKPSSLAHPLQRGAWWQFKHLVSPTSGVSRWLMQGSQGRPFVAKNKGAPATAATTSVDVPQNNEAFLNGLGNLMSAASDSPDPQCSDRGEVIAKPEQTTCTNHRDCHLQAPGWLCGGEQKGKRVCQGPSATIQQLHLGTQLPGKNVLKRVYDLSSHNTSKKRSAKSFLNTSELMAPILFGVIALLITYAALEDNFCRAKSQHNSRTTSSSSFHRQDSLTSSSTGSNTTTSSTGSSEYSLSDSQGSTQ